MHKGHQTCQTFQQVSEQLGRIRRCSGVQQAGLGPGRRLSESVVPWSTSMIARGNVGCGDFM